MSHFREGLNMTQLKRKNRYYFTPNSEIINTVLGPKTVILIKCRTQHQDYNE